MFIREKHHLFSIVLPLYNPTGNWVQLFQQNIRELNEMLPPEFSVQYIVVYDGPASPEIASSFETILRSSSSVTLTSYPKNMGKGYALRQGVKLADTSYVLVTDFDFPYKKENIIELMQALLDGYDIVAGKRAKSYFRQLPFKRKIISRLCVRLQKTFLHLSLYDTQSGIKGFNAKGREVFLQTTVNRFLVDTEFILRASNSDLSIKQMDIELEPRVKFSNFGLRVIATEVSNFIKLVRLNRTLGKKTAI